MEQSRPVSMKLLENTAKENERQKAEGTYVRKPFEDVELYQKYDHEILDSRNYHSHLNSGFTFCNWEKLDA